MSKLEAEIMGLKAELQVSEDRRRVAEAEAYDFKKQAREHGDPKTLSLNFEMLKSQKHEIEKKLDAEVKIKLDLFSALGNAKRQLRDQDGKKMLVHHIKKKDGISHETRLKRNLYSKLMKFVEKLVLHYFKSPLSLGSQVVVGFYQRMKVRLVKLMITKNLKLFEFLYSQKCFLEYRTIMPFGHV